MDTQVQVKLIMSRSVKSGEKTKSCQGQFTRFPLKSYSVFINFTIRNNSTKSFSATFVVRCIENESRLKYFPDDFSVTSISVSKEFLWFKLMTGRFKKWSKMSPFWQINLWYSGFQLYGKISVLISYWLGLFFH